MTITAQHNQQIRDHRSTPLFIEFNINNGFFVADHSIEEVEQMIAFYGENFQARKPKQLTHFNPE